MDDYQLTKCPLCDRDNCKVSGHPRSAMTNVYHCNNCAAFVLDTDVLAISSTISYGSIVRTQDKKPRNAVYNFILHKPLRDGDPVYAFTMNGDKVSSYQNANIAVNELMKSYPLEDNEYKLYKILENLYAKFGKTKFDKFSIDPPLMFCETDKPLEEIEFWVDALLRQKFIQDSTPLGIMSFDEARALQYTITLTGIEYLKKGISTIQDTEKMDKEKLTINNNVTVSPTIQNVVNTEVNINITQSAVVEAIEQSSLSQEEKQEIKDLIESIQVLIKKDKPSAWKKIKSVFAWIANKTVDVALAATLVPYLAEIVKGLARCN